MSYNLNKTDGTLLTELVDGVLDINTTDISLVGRNYSGYGEFINENFIRMLENFANPNSPVTPLKGQLWYDTSESKLKLACTRFELSKMAKNNFILFDYYVNKDE